jgi:hypothetical protein
VRKRYTPVLAPQTVLTLGGSFFHYRPVLDVRLTGPQGTRLRDCLLDTGADETMLHEGLAALLGVDLDGAEERQIQLVGRPAPVRC